MKSFIVKCLFSNQWVAPNNKRTWHKHEAQKFGELEVSYFLKGGHYQVYKISD